MNIVGIYIIKNEANGKVYVGQSRDSESRIMHHINKLRQGKHPNIPMQTDYNRSHGDFSFSIIEKCDESNLDDLEEKYIQMYKSNCAEYGYNKRSGGYSHWKMSEDEKRIISKRFSNANKGRKMSEEFKRNLRALMSGPGNPLYGKHLSEETKKKISDKKSKPIICVETGIVYKNTYVASEETGVSRASIVSHIRGKSKSAGGYHWKYANQ